MRTRSNIADKRAPTRGSSSNSSSGSAGILPSGIAAGSASLSHIVYALLRRAVIEGRLAPGATLHEPGIAARLGVSRTPVREALLRLQGDGLVAIRPQSGTTVAPIDFDRVAEALIVREALEVRMIGFVVDRTDDGFLASLHQTAADMARAHADGANTRYIAADDAFHRLLAERSGLKLVAGILDGVNAHLDRLRYMSISAPGRNKAAIAEHRAIIEGLQNRNADAAHRAMDEHMRATRRIVEALCDAARRGPAPVPAAPPATPPKKTRIPKG